MKAVIQLALLVGLAGTLTCDAALTLPGVFSEHMVLQRGQPYDYQMVVIWQE